MYYAFYETYASFSLIKTSTQIVDVGDAVSENVIHIPSFFFLGFILIYIIGYIILKKKKLLNKIMTYSIKQYSIYIGTIVIVGLVFVTTISTHTITKINCNWNKPYVVEKIGILAYQLNDIILSVNKNNLSSAEKAMWLNELRLLKQTNDSKIENEYTNIYKGKNVIMIHAESIQNTVLNKTFNGKELTPTLNKLVKEGLYFSNYYAPVSQGTSSDTEFMLHTSLLPATKGTAFMNYYQNNYITFLDSLSNAGYTTNSMHGNIGEFWNRKTMYNALGYDNFYDKEDYKIDETIGLGLSDKSFFKQSVPIIKNHREGLLFSYLITLTNHTPFSYLEHYGEYDLKYHTKEEDFPYLEGTKIGNYFRSVHYFDSCLKEFINNLDKEGILENSIIVLYGDHENLYPMEEYNILYNYDFNTGKIIESSAKEYTKYDKYDDKFEKGIPLVIWDKNNKLKTTVDTIMSTIDIMPTLSNMLGIQSGKYALGNDVINLENNVVIFPNSDWMTKDYYYDSHKEIIITRNGASINQEETDKINHDVYKKMILSQIIIENNLLDEVKED